MIKGKKIIGFLCAWAREEFAEPALRQAEKICDEVYVATECFHPRLERYKDKTEEICEGFARRNDKVKYMDAETDPEKSYHHNMEFVLNQLLDEATPNEGDIIWLFDVDEFYSDVALKEIWQFLRDNPDFTTVRFASRFFSIDRSHFVSHGHDKVHRFWKGRYWGMASRLMPKPSHIPIILEDNPMFHYSLLTSIDYNSDHWEVSFGRPLPIKQIKKMHWANQIFPHYTPKNEEFWKKKNQQVTGNYGFAWNDDFEEAPDGGLIEYNGSHPNIVADTLETIELDGDFRKYYIEKQKKLDKKNYMKRKIRAAQEKPLIVGPFLGELGYELNFFVPVARKTAEDFDEVISIVKRGYEYLYEDFSDKIITHDLDPKDKYKFNSRGRSFFKGDLVKYCDPKKLEKVKCELKDLIGTREALTFESTRGLVDADKEYCKY